jgi:hypothetical protein
MSEKSLDSKVRRAARKVGLQAYKSRWRSGSIDNYGDPDRNYPVAGFRWDMTAEEVIEYCGAGGDQ